MDVDRHCQHSSEFCPIRLILVLHVKAPAPCHFGPLSGLPHVHTARWSSFVPIYLVWLAWVRFWVFIYLLIFPGRIKFSLSAPSHFAGTVLFFVSDRPSGAKPAWGHVSFSFLYDTLSSILSKALGHIPSSYKIATVYFLLPLLDQQCLEPSGQQINVCWMVEWMKLLVCRIVAVWQNCYYDPLEKELHASFQDKSVVVTTLLWLFSLSIASGSSQSSLTPAKQKPIHLDSPTS